MQGVRRRTGTAPQTCVGHREPTTSQGGLPDGNSTGLAQHLARPTRIELDIRHNEIEMKGAMVGERGEDSPAFEVEMKRARSTFVLHSRAVRVKNEQKTSDGKSEQRPGLVGSRFLRLEVSRLLYGAFGPE